MKSGYLFFCIILFSLRLHGQAAMGVEAGIGMSSMKFVPSSYPILYTSASTNAIASGKIGILGDLPLSEHIYFQTGLYVSLRGEGRQFSYYRNDSFHESVSQSLYLYYGDLPLNVVYKTGIQGRGRFIAGMGATVSLMLYGKNKLSDNAVFNDTASNTNSDGNVAAGSTIHTFDLGLNMFAGYETPAGFFFRAYYTAGFQDIGIGTEVDKTRIWGVSAGYFFGKKRNVNKEAGDLIDKGPLPGEK